MLRKKNNWMWKIIKISLRSQADDQILWWKGNHLQEVNWITETNKKRVRIKVRTWQCNKWKIKEINKR